MSALVSFICELPYLCRCASGCTRPLLLRGPAPKEVGWRCAPHRGEEWTRTARARLERSRLADALYRNHKLSSGTQAPQS